MAKKWGCTWLNNKVTWPLPCPWTQTPMDSAKGMLQPAHAASTVGWGPTDWITDWGPCVGSVTSQLCWSKGKAPPGDWESITSFSWTIQVYIRGHSCVLLRPQREQSHVRGCAPCVQGIPAVERSFCSQHQHSLVFHGNSNAGNSNAGNI